MRAALLLLDFLIALLPNAFRNSYGREIRADFVDHWNDRMQSHQRVRRTLQLAGLLVTAYGMSPGPAFQISIFCDAASDP